jgi:hypothetical protein
MTGIQELEHLRGNPRWRVESRLATVSDVVTTQGLD